MRCNSSTGTSRRMVYLILVVLTILLVLVSGCATTRPADYMVTGFDVAVVEDVQVLPVLDNRIDQSKELDLDDWVLPIAERHLKKRGYSFTIIKERSLVSSIAGGALENPTPEFISSLPPEAARWVLLLSLDDSTSKLTFGSTGNAEMSGYLFDKSKGELAWRNKELGRAGQGGLIGMAFKGMMEKSAIQVATQRMFQTLPIREK